MELANNERSPSFLDPSYIVSAQPCLGLAGDFSIRSNGQQLIDEITGAYQTDGAIGSRCLRRRAKRTTSAATIIRHASVTAAKMSKPVLVNTEPPPAAGAAELVVDVEVALPLYDALL